MSAPRIASKITIVPSTLGETEFLGPESFARVIEVDMVAGTITVTARPATEPGLTAFDWHVPLVPLSTLNPLVHELAPFVQHALAGASIREAAPDELPISFTTDALDELEDADEIVFAFYEHWMGRPYRGLRAAKCAKCGLRILHGINFHDERWVDAAGKRAGCDAGGGHEPSPFGHPDAPHLWSEGHELDLTEDDSGGWSGVCECGGRKGADPSGWKRLGAEHFVEHAAAIPPDAPFEI